MNYHSWEVLHVLPNPDPGIDPATVTWSPDGAHLAVLDVEGNVRVWSPGRSGGPIEIVSKEQRTWAISWSPDGSRLATRCLPRSRWNLKFFGFDAHHTAFLPMTSYPLEEQAGSGDDEGGPVRVWDPDTGELVQEFPDVPHFGIPREGAVPPLSWTGNTASLPDLASSRWIRPASSLRDSTTRDLVMICRPPVPRRPPTVHWSPTGNLVAEANVSSFMVNIYDADTGETVSTAFALDPILGRSIHDLLSEYGSLSCQWSLDGRLLLTVASRTLLGGDSELRIWDVANSTCLLKVSNALIPLLSPDGTRIAILRRPNRIGGTCVAEAEGEVPEENDGPVRPWSLELHLEVWDIDAGTILCSMDDCTVMTWGPDGSCIGLHGPDGQITFWDLDERRPLFSTDNEPGTIVQMSWSPQGDRLATIHSDGSIEIWGPEIKAAI